MIIITHENGVSVSNVSEIGIIDEMADDRKSVKRKRVIKCKNVYNVSGELKRNDIVECAMQTSSGKQCFNGFVQMHSDNTTIVITGSETNIEKISNFVKLNT